MSNIRQIDAIIFDLDGTLADTFGLIVAAWNAALTPHTGKVYSPEDVIARFGPPDSQMIRNELTGPLAEQAIEAYHAHYEKNHDIVSAFEGIDALLLELARRKVPLGLMTGKGRRSAEITLEALNWQDRFGAVVTGDDIQHQKPAPDGPLQAARILQVSPRSCAFVGDSPADMLAGRAARMVTVAAAWHGHYTDKIRALKPDVWAESPADVLKLI
jgi:HAD superfamily hydrolase (TIGR01509 family)